MKIRLLIFILTYPIISQFIMSCCGCEDTVVRTYQNCSFETTFVDNSGEEPVISSGPILKEALGVELDIFRSEQTCLNAKQSFFTMSELKAYDCDCPPDFIIEPVDSIVSIDVLTLVPYNDTITSGESIESFIGIVDNSAILRFDEYLDSSRDLFFSEIGLEENIMLLFMEPPSEAGSYQFRIIITLSNGDTIENETDLVELI